MTYVRTSVVLEESLVKAVKVRYKNVSEGIRTIIREHLEEHKGPELFGILKGKISTKDLARLEKEEEKAHAELYRRYIRLD